MGFTHCLCRRRWGRCIILQGLVSHQPLQWRSKHHRLSSPVSIRDDPISYGEKDVGVNPVPSHSWSRKYHSTVNISLDICTGGTAIGLSRHKSRVVGGCVVGALLNARKSEFRATSGRTPTG